MVLTPNGVKQKFLTKLTDQKTANYPSILIILMGSLGDVTRGLCLVSHIKRNLPQSRISWLVETKWSQLVRLNRQIDRVIIFKRAWRLSALQQLYKNLHEEKYDIVMDLQRILKSGFFSLLAGARRRIGFHRRNAKEFNWLFNNEHIGYYSNDYPKIRHYLKFTEYLGLPEPEDHELDFGFSRLEVTETAPRIITELRHNFAAVLVGTSWDTKNWYFESYLNLVRRILADLKLTVVLVGDDAQRTMAADLVEKINAPDVINLVALTSLPQLAAVLKAAAVGIGPDSGPGHLAAAVGTPFVSLFGPTSPARTAPYGCERLVVKTAIDCAPCYKRRCTRRNKECLSGISVDAVMEKLSMALGGIHAS